jgi:hypothetical protein
MLTYFANELQLVDITFEIITQFNPPLKKFGLINHCMGHSLNNSGRPREEIPDDC